MEEGNTLRRLRQGGIGGNEGGGVFVNPKASDSGQAFLLLSQ